MINNNRTIVAARVRECWCTNLCIETLPDRKILVIAGPDDSSITLKKCHVPTEDYLLVSNHVEIDTRLFVHAQAISYEDIRSITNQASDTDIIILAIAHVLHLDVDNIYIKSFNTKGKFDAFVNVRKIALTIRQTFSIDRCLLIVIHRLSDSLIQHHLCEIFQKQICFERSFPTHIDMLSLKNFFFAVIQ